MKSEELLARIEAYHGGLNDYYNRIKAKTEDKRAKMLLEYLGDREGRFAKGVKRFRKTALENTEETWQQYVPATEKLEVPDPKTSEENRSFDDMANEARDLDERLKRFLQVMANKAGAPGKLRGIFEGLLEQQQREERKLNQSIIDIAKI
ncbi:MAG: hypothetical protein GF344_04375 [Chitinivibrionales bacterium]|nr:hypothetical protein [Chitinivibrionales bacterium]MBD3356279.1 hypothetical protein [Chitinivibrionales bacterium]